MQRNACMGRGVVAIGFGSRGLGLRMFRNQAWCCRASSCVFRDVKSG